MNDRRLDRLKLAAGTVLISGAAFAQPTPKKSDKPEIRTNSPGPNSQRQCCSTHLLTRCPTRGGLRRSRRCT